MKNGRNGCGLAKCLPFEREVVVHLGLETKAIQKINTVAQRCARDPKLFKAFEQALAVGFSELANELDKNTRDAA